MEVKVGQVWQQISSDTRYEVAAVSDKECVLNTKDGFFLMSISGAENLLMTCALVNEPEKSLSDLEIVQKALDKTRASLSVNNGDFIVDEFESCGGNTVAVIDSAIFENAESLLTWAKQTINQGNNT